MKMTDTLTDAQEIESMHEEARRFLLTVDLCRPDEQFNFALEREAAQRNKAKQSEHIKELYHELNAVRNQLQTYQYRIDSLKAEINQTPCGLTRGREPGM